MGVVAVVVPVVLVRMLPHYAAATVDLDTL
jgi:hypothetical protein